MSGHSERLELLAQGWDETAAGYEEYFVPRFAPWVELAVRALGELPGGPVLVPCCGTFPELPGLLDAFPGREIAGIDLSPGMVKLARERAAALAPSGQVRAVVGDATDPGAGWTGACAGVLSVFGLQQIPEPEAAVRAWAAALKPGGRLSVVFWPSEVEHEGPFELARRVITARLPAEDSSWEERLEDVIAEAGLTLERDERPAFPMSHADAATFWEAMTRSGPARALALAKGEPFMAELREEFLRKSPAGGITHQSAARLLVAGRPPQR